MDQHASSPTEPIKAGGAEQCCDNDGGGASGGPGGGAPAFSPSLDFSDSRNSQYLGLV